MTAPAELAQAVRQARFDGVQVNIASDLKKIIIGLYRNGFVSTAKQGPITFVLAVEPLGIDAIQVAHESGKVAFRGVDKQVVMVGHQAIGGDPDPEPGAGFSQGFQIQQIVFPIQKDCPAAETAVHHMVPGAGIFDAQWTGHVRNLQQS